MLNETILSSYPNTESDYLLFLYTIMTRFELLEQETVTPETTQEETETVDWQTPDESVKEEDTTEVDQVSE